MAYGVSSNGGKTLKPIAAELEKKKYAYKVVVKYFYKYSVLV